MLLLIGSASNSQNNFAILKTNYEEGSFKVFYENARVENLIDTVKLDKYLDKVSPVIAKHEDDRVLFKCLEYLEEKGYELISFSMFPSEFRQITKTAFFTANIFSESGEIK